MMSKGFCNNVFALTLIDMIIKYSVGLDVSGDEIKCCISTIDSSQLVKVKATTTIPNRLSGFEKLHTWIGKHHKEKSIHLVICMEATGVYHENCALFLNEHSYAVAVVLANKAKRYLQSLGLKSKNDSIDAKGLAQMGAEQKLRTWSPMSKDFHALRTLTRHHQSLQERKTSIRNQLHAEERGMYVVESVIQNLKDALTLIDKQLKELLKSIKEQIRSNKEIATKVKNICTVKGLGILTVATIIAETNGFELFDNQKQVVSYAGYDVVENQSGNHVGKTKISKRGNPRIRRILFMPAFSAKKHDGSIFSSLYERTFAKHGIKMKSYVAIQKKLLVLIYHLWRKNVPFDPNYHLKMKEEEMLFSV
jgi:transposase